MKQVPSCKNYKNGECKYGREKCWFNHTSEEIFNENENVMERIFKMMEKMTERIMNMEKDKNKNDEVEIDKTRSKDKLNYKDEKVVSKYT